MFRKEEDVLFMAHHHLVIVNNIYKSAIIILFLGLIGCGGQNSSYPYLVSMTALLGNPEEFDGKKVVVVGYLKSGGDVYLTEEHARIDDLTSSLFLNINNDTRVRLTNSFCKNKHVEVTGTFGLAKIKWMETRVGLNDVESIKEKLSGKNCVDNIVAGEKRQTQMNVDEIKEEKIRNENLMEHKRGRSD